MALSFHVCTTLSIALFLYYGIACLFADGMVAEFERFGLARFRRLTGALEISGAVGLGVGYLLPAATLVSAAGLTLLMILGVATRIRVRDSVVDTMPAVILGLVNLYILLYALRVIGA
ncbi:MAG: DoxX family protein [Gemmatimonadetes bacterium]|nr:DoxX family protein [Gemmatimonadota bacterium]NNK64978.1 DoxX family protein [Gemmatimonadota bacterium]